MIDKVMMSMDNLPLDFKKQLFRIYSDTSKAIYGFGVIELKINFIDDMIIFRTRDNRVPILKVLEEKHYE